LSQTMFQFAVLESPLYFIELTILDGPPRPPSNQ
jgi:hypothetical protein